MDPYQQPETPTEDTGNTQPVSQSGAVVEGAYQPPVDTLAQTPTTEPVMSEPDSTATEGFTSPVVETTPPLPSEPPVVYSTTPSENTVPTSVASPVAKKSRLWLWLSLVVVVLALAAVLLFVYVL